MSDFKTLSFTIDECLLRGTPKAGRKLEKLLRQHRPSFINLLKNPVSCSSVSFCFFLVFFSFLIFIIYLFFFLYY